jgi:subtilisin-like proprotein convertase family protein
MKNAPRPIRLALAICAALAWGCTGEDGEDGRSALLTTTPEPSGASCAFGGTRIDSGLDVDAGGVLDPAEVTATEYVCNPDTYDPEILAVDPAPGEIANGASFAVAFSEAMDPATVDATSVFLLPVGGDMEIEQDGDGDGAVPATVTYDEATRTATLDPVEPLWMWTEYELHVTSHLRDLEGNSLPAFVGTYWITEDTAPPRVVQVTPVDGGVVGPYASIALGFDEPLNESGYLAALTLADGSGAPVAGYSAWDGGTMVFFVPDGALFDGETYTASIEAFVADGEGNSDYLVLSWSFSVDDEVVPLMTGQPVASPASQDAGGLVEITVPVNAPARQAEIYVGDDEGGWYQEIGWMYGNYAGEGTITGTFTVPVPPASGGYSIWVVLYDESWSQVSIYYASSAISAVNYTTGNSADWTERDSGIPLAYLEVRAGVDLSAAVDFVPGTGGAGEIHYSFTNAGMTDAGPFYAGIFVNPEALPQIYQLPDHLLPFEGLAAGATVTGTIPVSGLPETVTAVYAIVDLAASVDEFDEGNNFAADGHRWSTGTAYPNTTVVPISDHTWSYSSTGVSGGPASIADATVTLNVTHTYTGDLEVWLTSPAGTPVSLAYHRGGWGDNFTSTVFDDLAAISIASGSAPFTGTFRPEQPLGTLAGEGADGTWTLSVYDWAGGDVGTIDSWTLTLW